MKKLLSLSLSLWLLAPAHAAAPPRPAAADDKEPGRPTLRRRDPAPDDAAAAQPAAQAGALEQRLVDLSQQISREMSDNQKRTVAVVEFADLKGRITDFGRFLAEELITRLYQTRKFKVIERQLLNKVISEQKLSLTGIIDQTSAQKLGRLLGVDAIASGSISDLGRTLRVNARLIDTSTAEVFAVASTEIIKDDAVARLMGADSPTAAAPDAVGAPAQGPPGRRVLQKIDTNFFTFELHQCLVSGSTIICELTVTNTDTDKRIGLGGMTKLFDDLGNEYASARVRIANQEDRNVYAVMVNSVAVKVRFTFESVSPQASRISLLDVYVNPQPGNDFHVQFRNVPMRRQGAAGDDAGEDGPGGEVTASVAAGMERTITVNGNEQWTDTGIDVAAGMRLEVVASGRVFISDQSSPTGQILGGLLTGRNGTRAPPRSVGPAALLAKIRYARGGESNVLKVGERNTLIVGQGEEGRLIFGIDDRSVRDNSGHFTVKVRW